MREPTIQRNALFNKLGYKPHSAEQWAVHNDDSRFRVACCGRRWGKSTAFGHEMTLRMFIPDSRHWIVGPNYTLGEKEFRVVLLDFKKLGLLSKCRVQNNVNQGNMRIHFQPLNSIVEVKTAEKKDGLVGEGLDSVCMSEAAKHDPSTWQMYIRPALADNHGHADFPSTPQGFNWFQGAYELGQQGGEWKSWRLPSWSNPVVYPGGRDDSEIKSIESEVSEMYFLQEIAAEFTAFEGMIYPEFDEERHVKRIDYNPELSNYLVFDFGYTDPFVCLDIQVDRQGRVYVWREYQVSYKSTGEHGLHLANRDNPPNYRIADMFADPRGADGIATLSLILGPIQAHPVGWELGIEQIRRAMKVRPDGTTGLTIDPGCRHLIRQLKGLRKKTVKEGHNEKPGQHDYDDHGPDALRYFFNEYFVLGAMEGLADIYDVAYRDSQAAGFFSYESSLTTGKAFNL